jgi:integrase
MPFLNRFVAAMVRVQWYTGARPGEVCIMRQCDLDTTGEVWLYNPSRHKTQHHGKQRPIPIGPNAQEILKQFFTDNPHAYLFDASKAVAESRARRSAMRKTPRWRSHMTRNRLKRKRKPEWVPGACYQVHSYEVNIERACDLAFPLPAHLAQGEHEPYDDWRARLSEQQLAEVKAWRKSHRWHPNQIRHTFATSVREKYGLEAAQVLLGHTRADVTQVYAERNLNLALEVAKSIG